MKLNVGDVLYEPLSRNTGQITDIFEHPAGRLVRVRWRPGDRELPHDAEYFYKKLMRCVKSGEFEYTPGAETPTG
ncbi:MAG: hypothetical protein COV67_10595 [Nitrospinae bacterium CG11_big_fil_rev_8_21_14_0_20_56_8]|nr:MAG: hypothetical protein COV67_10595 [Nitrospinae bacterium CG11_big_fil_rev_8_21_14_0_20_56_8]